jgi:hypothetical protein
MEMREWPIIAYVCIGAILYARTWGHFRDGRFFPRVAELPRAERYTEEGQKRLRAMWRFYLVGLPVALVLVWWLR